MNPGKTRITTIDEYIAVFPREIQVLLEQMRAAIRTAAPEAEEKISYQMPAFALHGNLVYFAAWKKHIGFYPTSSSTRKFARELSVFEFAKGSVKFPIEKPLPLRLIARIVKFRVAENLAKAKAKGRARKTR
jgi:uncharacterized protein YdhG (YjbR/CyaY superfamily)